MERMTEAPQSPEPNGTPTPAGASWRPGAVVVVGPDGRPVGTMSAGGESQAEDPSQLIEQPAKVMRIGSMIKQLLEEVRAAPLDEASRQRLREIDRSSIRELSEGRAPEAK